MSATKVKLRKRTLPSGKITLYLDFYPPVRNPKTLELSRREYLGIYLKSNPRTLQDREENAEKIRIAEGIRATREISILNHQFGFIDRSTPKMDFLAWYRSQVEKNNKNWAFAYNYFYQYVDGHCTMGDITLELCKGFREYLLTAKLIKNQKKALNQNSASGYWSTFRALLAIAYREHLIKENVNDYLEAISDVETRREYLTLEELRDLADTPCEIPVLKAASLFSCLTGLRISDLLQLRWSGYDGTHIRLQMQKTGRPVAVPVTASVRAVLERYRNLFTQAGDFVFPMLRPDGGKGLFSHAKALIYATGRVNFQIKRLARRAGIQKTISTHTGRHTFATMLISKGASIYDVKELLGHSDVKVTQLYARLVDRRKQELVEMLE